MATEQRLKQRSLWSQVDSFLSSPKIPKIRQLFWWPDTFFTIEHHELHLAINIIAMMCFYFIAMTSFLILSNALELGPRNHCCKTLSQPPSKQIGNNWAGIGDGEKVKKSELFWLFFSGTRIELSGFIRVLSVLPRHGTRWTPCGSDVSRATTLTSSWAPRTVSTKLRKSNQTPEIKPT